MINFILKRQPKAYQGSKTFKSVTAKTDYVEALKAAVEQFNTITSLMADELYGLVYYFYKKKTGTDADNISKPIWDCLKGILYNDDKSIRLRTAGVIDISEKDLNVIDFSNVRGEIVADIIEAFDAPELNHFVYIECGLLKNAMFKFNLEYNGNQERIF